MAKRVIQTFLGTCSECPNCVYYSGGMHHCSLTEERFTVSDTKYDVGKFCPLPFAGPPSLPASVPTLPETTDTRA